tara:strand:+ start:4466 stop:5137 length:672 start_codon:yes stop_codon:yes gene_type:complete
MNDVPVIAIDGLASSGKTSVSKQLSKKLKFYFLDSGILYRSIGYIHKLESLDLNSEKEVKNIINNIELLPSKDLQFQVFYKNKDITNFLYSEEIGLQASIVSQYKLVRDLLLFLQHSCVQNPGLIANGRDMGTKVFPNAKLKIYFTADLEIRASRRHKQLLESGINSDLESITNMLKDRDNSDKDRIISPLKAADDAIIIDSSNLKIDTVLDKILELYKISEA